MKNHWIKISNLKKSKFHTVEFLHNGIFVLKPRKVEVIKNPKFNNNQLKNDSLTLLFKNVFSLNNNDFEMVNFLSSVKDKISDWLCKLRNYQFSKNDNNIINELNCFEFNKLNYNSLVNGNSIEDVKLTFNYEELKFFDKK
jgi:hypothetical protein